MSTQVLPDVVELRNGDKAPGIFPDEEIDRRLQRLRGYMEEQGIRHVLFTSYHNIDYYSGYLYCSFGRDYGLVVSSDANTTISANIDYGQPWRRSHGANITYTDWRRDNFFRAIARLIPNGTTVGIEHDHLTLRNLAKLESRS